MSKPVVIFDLDDTLINLRDELYKALVAKYGKEVVPHWEFWKGDHCENNFNLTVQDIIDTSTEARIFDRVKSVPSATTILQDLRDKGFHVIILTSRDGFLPDAKARTIDYVQSNNLVCDELIVGTFGVNKMEYLKHHPRILFTVDDQEKNCINFQQSGKVDKVFLSALPCNSHCDTFTRVDDLFHIYPHIGLTRP